MYIHTTVHVSLVIDVNINSECFLLNCHSYSYATWYIVYGCPTDKGAIDSFAT